MDASRDNNFVAGKLGVLYTDPTVTIPITINESNDGVMVNTTDTVQFTMTPIAPTDSNYEKVLLWKGTDGLAYPFVVDNDGAILIDT